MTPSSVRKVVTSTVRISGFLRSGGAATAEQEVRDGEYPRRVGEGHRCRPRLLRPPDLVGGPAPDVDECCELQYRVDRGGDRERAALARAQVAPSPFPDHVDHLLSA